MPDVGAGPAGFSVFPITGIPEVIPGDDIAALIADRFTGRDDDIVVVTSKVVSKAEGRFRPAAEKQQAIEEESRRVVASRETDHGTILITENHLGIVQANAGIDESNSPTATSSCCRRTRTGRRAPSARRWRPAGGRGSRW